MLRPILLSLALLIPLAAMAQPPAPAESEAPPVSVESTEGMMLIAEYQALLQRREAGDKSPATLAAYEQARKKAVSGLVGQLSAAKTAQDAGMPLYFLALMKGEAREAAPQVLALYKSQRDVRPVALNTLVRIAPKDAAVRAIFESERAGGELRLLAIELTGIADSPSQALAFLRPMLTSKNDDERAAAVRGVAQLGPEGRAVLPAVMAATRDANPDVRAAAARSLGILAPWEDSTVRRLMEMLDEKEPVGSSAASGLGYCGAKAAPALPKMRAYTQLLPAVKALSVNMAIRKVERAVADSEAKKPARTAAPSRKP